eukprot:2139963-Pleurochrysis_carterae.AAC.1
MAAATRNHAAEVLPGGNCAAESITAEVTAENRQRLSGMPMTSSGAERLFALERAQPLRPRWSKPRRHACGRHPWPRQRHRGLDARARQRRGEVEAAAQEGAAEPQGDHTGEAHGVGLGAAGDAQGQARREARRARGEGLRARACRALLRPQADG